MEPIRKRLLTAAFLLLVSILTTASPARRSRVTLQQKDGTRIEAILSGDEFTHILTTLDGCAIALDADGEAYRYVRFREDGTRIVTRFRADDPSVPASVRAQSRAIPYEAFKRFADERRAQIAPARNRQLRQFRSEEDEEEEEEIVPTEHHILVLLAQFSDLKFHYTRDDFEMLLSLGEKSARQYFNDQFVSIQKTFSIDIAPIVTLPNRYSYYGKNNTAGNDTNPHLMVRDACQLADPDVDYSLYDTDGDGVLDNVFIFYAGGDESDGAGDDHIWSHQWYLRDGAGMNVSLDGVIINSYACTAELMRSSRGSLTLTSIGTFCHEYSHTFGLPDYYDTDYEASGGISEALWMTLALMDCGNRNDGGQTPPWYNAVDRYLLGLSEPRPLELGEQRLSPIHESGDYLILETDKAGEYFLFECRAHEGWDSAIGGHGLLIYHIDRSDNMAGEKTAALRWRSNTLNCYPNHPCVDLIEADPTAPSRFATARSNGTILDQIGSVFFPYIDHIAYTPNTQPPFIFWSGTGSSLSLSDIHFDGHDIVFTVSGSQVIRLPEIATFTGDIFQDGAILSWTTDLPDYSANTFLSWGPVGREPYEIEIRPYEPGHYAWTLDNLDPKKAYATKVYIKTAGSPVNAKTYNFTTKSVHEGSRPFIWLKGAQRNADGSFVSGTRIPLRIYHRPTGTSVKWLLDGEEVSVGPDGYLTLTRSGELKAILTDSRGDETILLKNIVVR